MNKKIPNPLGGKVLNPFPVYRTATDTYGWADCPVLAKAVWGRIRKNYPKLTWYAADMVILSPTSIELRVYDIADNFRGGIGERVHTEVITELTLEEQNLLNKELMVIYTSAAESAIDREDAEARRLRIVARRIEMFGI